MRHFVLVHGACHGAWCWYKVIAELKQAGHKVTALDLTACGIDRRQVEDVHGSVVEYSEPLLTFMASLPAAGSDDEKVILVGHSMAGSSLCMAMERFPEKISVAAFLAAGMLGPDLTSQMVDEKVKFSTLYSRNLTESISMLTCASIYYTQDLELGITLVRPCPIWDAEEAARDTVLTNDRYGTVARAYVVCDEEKDGAFQWWLIENNPPDEHVVIPGSDHMVMFSQPSLLSEYLLQLAAKYI
ncbi:unnamed protein product [Linum tenue]|uniref:AB hydrolase-1 domain-containing protein n=1 Tax=Linum tenue TaxID=586396 RepID=A0AAV0JH41_9ROSI|nr:unnamed protein product [Linum tenue]